MQAGNELLTFSQNPFTQLKSHHHQWNPSLKTALKKKLNKSGVKSRVVLSQGFSYKKI